MTLEETRVVVEGFLGGHAGHWLAEDVDFYDSARSRHYRGRAEAAERFARCRPTSDRRLLIIDEGYAAVEVELRETPAGPAVPMAAIYEVRAGEIVAARFYCAPAAPNGEGL